jgi:hypothetical protein
VPRLPPQGRSRGATSRSSAWSSATASPRPAAYAPPRGSGTALRAWNGSGGGRSASSEPFNRKRCDLLGEMRLHGIQARVEDADHGVLGLLFGCALRIEGGRPGHDRLVAHRFKTPAPRWPTSAPSWPRPGRTRRPWRAGWKTCATPACRNSRPRAPQTLGLVDQ